MGMVVGDITNNIMAGLSETKASPLLTEPEYQQTLADQGWVAQWQIVIYCFTLKGSPCHCQWLHYKKYRTAAAAAASDDDDDDANDENNINAQQFS